MRGRGAAKRNKSDQARETGRRFASRLLALFAMIALVSQWFAPAFHAMEASRDQVVVAAELRAAFGDVAVLCVQAEDGKNPLAPSDPRGHCDDGCPLCQALSASLALVPPASVGPPERMEARAEIVASPEDRGPPRPRRMPLAQPRAPPFEV